MTVSPRRTQATTRGAGQRAGGRARRSGGGRNAGCRSASARDADPRGRLSRALAARTLVWTLGLAAGLALAPATAGAQADDPATTGTTGAAATPQTPTLIVNSRPEGAVVTLRGPFTWVGQTPWELYRPVDGLYEVVARLPGYETWSGEVVLGAGATRTLNIRLSPKTRWKAAARSLLIPGWGQFYSGADTKGTIFLLAEVGALVALGITHWDYRDEVDTFEAARDRYLSARDVEDLDELRRLAQEASNDADEAYDRRQLALGAAVGVWGLSLVDALFFGPSGYARPGSTAAVDPDSPATQEIQDARWAAYLDPSAEPRVGLTYRW